MPNWLVDQASVSSECIDGEVVAIHLGTGIYYSMRGPAATLWGVLVQPCDVAGLTRVLTEQFEVSADPAGKDVEIFLERLREEQLVSAVEAEVKNKPAEPAVKRLPYAPPQLERYADLQDLLLLDPIHEVGEQGWPQRPTGTP